MNPKDELLPCPFPGCKTKLETYLTCVRCVTHTNWITLEDWKRFPRHTPQPSADSGMKSAEEWHHNEKYVNAQRRLMFNWQCGCESCKHVRAIQQDAFAAGVRSTKEKGGDVK